MTAKLKLSIDSDLGSVATAARGVRAACAGMLAVDTIDEIEIAVAEAINNVITHGYAGKHGQDIALQLCLGPEEVVIEIIDHAVPIPEGLLAGIAADPFQFDAVDVASLPEGGRGLALIRLTMDGVAYSSEAGENRLRLTKKRRQGGP
jgi:serine/threonine-protein kinase RsbW